MRTRRAAFRALFESASKRRMTVVSAWLALMTRMAAKDSWIAEVRLLLASRASRAKCCRRGVYAATTATMGMVARMQISPRMGLNSQRTKSAKASFQTMLMGSRIAVSMIAVMVALSLVDAVDRVPRAGMAVVAERQVLRLLHHGHAQTLVYALDDPGVVVVQNTDLQDHHVG